MTDGIPASSLDVESAFRLSGLKGSQILKMLVSEVKATVVEAEKEKAACIICAQERVGRELLLGEIKQEMLVIKNILMKSYPKIEVDFQDVSGQLCYLLFLDGKNKMEVEP